MGWFILLICFSEIDQFTQVDKFILNSMNFFLFKQSTLILGFPEVGKKFNLLKLQISNLSLAIKQFNLVYVSTYLFQC